MSLPDVTARVARVSRAPTVVLAVDEATRGLTRDDRFLADALERRGADVVPLPWGGDVDPGAVIVIRSTWDYIDRPAAFARWLDRLENRRAPVYNPVALLRWNLHKRYLVELADRGVPTVPTRIVRAGERVDLATMRAQTGWSEIVVKPAIGGTARLAEHSGSGGMEALQAHLDRIVEREDALVQPFVESIATSGEISVVAIAGEPCLAIRKVPAPGDWRTQVEFAGTAETTTLTLALARLTTAALDALDASPAYARVDVTGDATDHRLIELELIEPELFFRFDTTVADRLAEHVLRRDAADSGRQQP